MSLWKQFLLGLYYHGTYPVRVYHYWWEVAQEHLPVIVLFYHRIADDRANQWTTSARMFTQQISWLADRFQFISLEEAQRRIRLGHNYDPCVSITFDDGYAENCRHAIPLLINKQIPCTYFVTLRNVLAQEPFSHDMVMGNRFMPNTLEQLQAMAAAGIEIGAHAYTHADLGAITDPRLLYYEVVTAGKELQAAIHQPVRYFAFPYGQRTNLNPAAFELARQAGYEGVCSAYGGFNYPGDDAFHLQRIAVDDNMLSLKNWVTMDPRRIHIPRFEYQKSNNGQDAVAIKQKELTEQIL